MWYLSSHWGLLEEVNVSKSRNLNLIFLQISMFTLIHICFYMSSHNFQMFWYKISIFWQYLDLSESCHRESEHMNKYFVLLATQYFTNFCDFFWFLFSTAFYLLFSLCFDFSLNINVYPYSYLLLYVKS